ncbi:MAG: hypothetical protein ACM30G_09535 [Micromonosporaceae bacterium]
MTITDSQWLHDAADHESGGDLSEYRAYLQRAETRLSTLHRVASAFISGAGLLTLLPLLVGGTFSGVLALILFYPAEGLSAPGSVQRWLAILPVLGSVALPLAALYFLIRDLILFYFTARTFRPENKGRVYPRFILSGIMVSEESLRTTLPELQAARDLEYVRNLLVPSPAALRRKILAEAHSVGDLRGYTMNDDENLLVEQLRQYVLRQTASDVRTLPQEAAKMEASIARHERFLRGLVLRYAKAFLLTILTTVATIAADGVLRLLRPVDSTRLEGVNPQYVWLSVLAIYAAWALAAVIIVRKPVFWLYADTSDTKTRRTPQSLLNFERATLGVGVATVSVVAAAAAVYIRSARIDGGMAWLTTGAIALMTAATLYFASRAFWTELAAGREPAS